MLSEQGKNRFDFDIKITDETNNKDEMATCTQEYRYQHQRRAHHVQPGTSLNGKHK